jgi:hypothetical protein
MNKGKSRAGAVHPGPYIEGCPLMSSGYSRS